MKEGFSMKEQERENKTDYTLVLLLFIAVGLTILNFV